MKQFSKLIKGRESVLLHTQGVKSECFDGINSMNEEKSECVNLIHTCKSKAKEHENTLSKYDNDSKKRLQVRLIRSKEKL